MLITNWFSVKVFFGEIGNELIFELMIICMKHPEQNDKLILGKFGNEKVATINWAKSVNNDHTLAFLTIGYKKSFEILMEESLKVPENYPVDIDFLINPVLFCLRHYVELVLKDTTRTFNIALQISKPDEIGFTQTHDILNLFGNLKQMFSTHRSRLNKKFFSDEFFNQLDITENLIKELSIYDQFSFAFRYPFKKTSKINEKVKDIIPEVSIDLINLKEIANKLIFTLEELKAESDAFETVEWLRINHGIV